MNKYNGGAECKSTGIGRFGGSPKLIDESGDFTKSEGPSCDVANEQREGFNELD